MTSLYGVFSLVWHGKCLLRAKYIPLRNANLQSNRDQILQSGETISNYCIYGWGFHPQCDDHLHNLCKSSHIAGIFVSWKILDTQESEHKVSSLYFFQSHSDQQNVIDLWIVTDPPAGSAKRGEKETRVETFIKFQRRPINGSIISCLLIFFKTFQKCYQTQLLLQYCNLHLQVSCWSLYYQPQTIVRLH